MFLGQPVPVVSTRHGYALFCEQCALGRNALSVRVGDPARFAMRIDSDPARRVGPLGEEE